MLEFNVHWGDGTLKELADLLEVIKKSGVEDARVNVIHGQQITRPVIPFMRMKQIIAAFGTNGSGQKQSLTKAELVAALTNDGAVSERTASVYVSNASSAGAIERTVDGYVMSPLGRELYST